MVLETRRWGPASAESVVCVHGITQHGAIFESLGQRLAARDKSVVAVDLRGHGDSGRKPPWNAETHVQDLLETLDAHGIERAAWVGHSFGGRLAAMAADLSPERTERLALLDAGLQVPVDLAERSAEIERLDWSFATVDGATEAMLSSNTMVAPPRDVVAAFVKDDVQRGPDGRFRFRFSPPTAVVAWSEMTLPPPPVARVPTLIVRCEHALFDASELALRYQEELGDLLTVVDVPNGHNVLWESPVETIDAIEAFIASS